MCQFLRSSLILKIVDVSYITINYIYATGSPCASFLSALKHISVYKNHTCQSISKIMSWSSAENKSVEHVCSSSFRQHFMCVWSFIPCEVNDCFFYRIIQVWLVKLRWAKRIILLWGIFAGNIRPAIHKTDILILYQCILGLYSHMCWEMAGTSIVVCIILHWKIICGSKQVNQGASFVYT